MKYDIDYFINKFQDIPGEYFTYSDEMDPMDAWEWCGEEEAQALYDLIKPFGILLQVNDGEEEWFSLGVGIKERILKFLKLVKTNSQMESLAI